MEDNIKNNFFKVYQYNLDIKIDTTDIYFDSNVHWRNRKTCNIKVYEKESRKLIADILDIFYLTFNRFRGILLYPFLNWNDNDDDLLETVVGSFLICKICENNGVFSLEYYLNKNHRNRNFSSHSREHLLKIFINQIIKDSNDIKASKIFNNILTQTNQEPKASVLSVPNLNITLFNYQIDDIKWMASIENNVKNKKSNKIDYTFKTYFKVLINLVNGELLIDDNKDYNYIYSDGLYGPELIQKINQPELNILTENFNYYGGNIISNVGFGKTLIILCYILQDKNTFNNFVEFVDNDFCKYFYKRGIQKGNTCKKKKSKGTDSSDNPQYCTEHSKTLFLDKRITQYKNLDKFYLYEYIDVQISRTSSETLVGGRNPRMYFKTNSSLIICPTHLCDQWATEYYNKFTESFKGTGKRVLLVVTNDQFTNLTVGDILFSDIIITSYSFLTKLETDCQDLEILIPDINLPLHLIEPFLKSNDGKLTNFSNYKFNRVVLDESSEIIGYPRYKIIETIIKSIKSNYRWNISGTPFPHGIKSFLHNSSYISNVEINREISDTKVLSMIDASQILYKRNTRDNVGSEKYNVSIKTTEIKLDFTEQERNIYNSYMSGKNINFLIKMCCDLNIATDTIKNCKTFDEIQKVILETNYDNMNKSLKIQEELKNNIELEEIELKGVDDSQIDWLSHIKAELKNNRRLLTIECNNYYSIKKIYDYLKNTIDNINFVTETCPICLDDITNEDLAITKCGHLFCWNCINEYINECGLTKCPKCNIGINKDEVYFYKEKKENLLINTGDIVSNLVNKLKSTKLGNIVYYLRYKLDPKDKIIVFSQWDTILDTIGKELTGIKFVDCKGSVYKRKQSIKQFCESTDTNILFLSTKNTASGLNLVAANKVLFVEPIHGALEYKESIYAQSIGRIIRLGQKRPVEIIKFIIKNTIEETIENELELVELKEEILEI
jgi:SNF2 family DNA or RNA helicase